jgi:flagellar assembly protein FliH
MSDEFVALDRPELWQRWREDAASLPTVGELEQAHDSARAEGLAAGLAEGRARAAAEAARLKALAQALDESAAALEREVADALLALALDIARQVLQEALPVKRELMLPAVREALRCLPAGAQGARILLNPADVELVRAHVGEELRLQHWQIVEDHRIQPGGCRLAAPDCEVDGTLATRWKRVLAALGTDHAWLDA